MVLFDNVGAKVAEQLRAERPRDDGGQIKNAETNQRSISLTKILQARAFERSRY